MIALETVCDPETSVWVCRARDISLSPNSKVLRMLLLRGNQEPQKGSNQAIKAAVLCLLSSLL